MLLKNISKNSNTSGQGADCVVPEEIAKKFNLGAIFIGFIWGPFNKTYITLAILPLAILPGTGFAALTLALFFGIKGDRKSVV